MNANIPVFQTRLRVSQTAGFGTLRTETRIYQNSNTLTSCRNVRVLHRHLEHTPRWRLGFGWPPSRCTPARTHSRTNHPHDLSGYASKYVFGSRLIRILQPLILNLRLRATYAGSAPACHQTISSPHVRMALLRVLRHRFKTIVSGCAPLLRMPASLSHSGISNVQQ